MDDELLIIDEHALKHGVSADDIGWAWEHFFAKRYRGAPREGEIVLAGFDHEGREVEIVAAIRSFGTVIFHANRPLSASVRRELEIDKRNGGLR